MRALLVQSAKKLLQVENPLRKWGLAVAARRGRNKAAVAVARKLCVAVWHVLQGHTIGALERLDTLHTKLHSLPPSSGCLRSKPWATRPRKPSCRRSSICSKATPET